MAKEIVIRVTLSVPDDAAVVKVDVMPMPPAAAALTDTGKIVSDRDFTIEDLRATFVAAVDINKAKAFAALGYPKCSEVPVEEYASTINALRSVTA